MDVYGLCVGHVRAEWFDRARVSVSVNGRRWMDWIDQQAPNPIKPSRVELTDWLTHPMPRPAADIMCGYCKAEELFFLKIFRTNFECPDEQTLLKKVG